MEGKQLETKKSFTGFRWYQDSMMAVFFWFFKLGNDCNSFHYLQVMNWDPTTCGIGSNSCELSGKCLDPKRVEFWCQTHEFGGFQVVSSYTQMLLVMGNWFAHVRSGPKLICASFNIIGHRPKQSQVPMLKHRPNPIHSCIL